MRMDANTMKLYVAVGTVVLLLMAVFIIIFVAYYQQQQANQQLALRELREQHRRALMDATFRGQEEERRRLAEDLHDGIGTMLSVTKMSLNQLERQLNGERLTGERTRMHVQVQKTRSMIDETMTNVRRISRDLVPTTLDRFGLLAALEELADRATDDRVSVQLDCADDLTCLPSPLELMLYRIAQELVNNALRHARARQIGMQVYCLADEVRLSVLDDGIGFDFDAIMEDKHRGLGLRNIESRLSVMDGHVTFDVAPGRGSRIHVQVRLREPQRIALLR